MLQSIFVPFYHPSKKKKRVNERPVNLSTVSDCHDGRKNAENKPILCLTAKTDRLDWTVKDLTFLPRKTCQRYGIFLWSLVRFSNGSISTGELLRSSNLVLSPHVAIAYSHIRMRENDLIKRPCAQSCPWAKSKSWVGFGGGRDNKSEYSDICFIFFVTDQGQDKAAWNEFMIRDLLWSSRCSFKELSDDE